MTIAKYIFGIFCIFLCGLGFFKTQNFAEVYEEYEKEFDKSPYEFNFEKLDSVIALCPDLSHYPKLLSQKGLSFFMKDKFDLAIKYYFLATEYTPKDSLGNLFQINLGLGDCYTYLKLLDQSNEYYLKAKEYAQEMNDPELIWTSENCIQANLADGGELQSIKNWHHWLTQNEGSDPCTNICFYLEISSIYMDKSYLNEAEKLMTQLKKQENLLDETCSNCRINYLLNWGQLFLAKGDNQESLKELRQLQVILPDDVLPTENIDLYSLLIQNFQETGPSDSLDKYMDLYHNLIAKEKLIALQRSSEKEKDLKELSEINANIKFQSNQQKWMAVLVILVLVFIFFIIIRWLYLNWKMIQNSSRKMSSENEKLKKNYLKIWNSYQFGMKQLEKIKDKIPKKEFIHQHGDLMTNLQNEKSTAHYNLNPEKDQIYQEIERKFPFLSEIEKLVCYYKTLNLSHKEIANILNRSVKSIDSYQYRIQQKIHEQETSDS